MSCGPKFHSKTFSIGTPENCPCAKLNLSIYLSIYPIMIKEYSYIDKYTYILV